MEIPDETLCSISHEKTEEEAKGKTRLESTDAQGEDNYLEGGYLEEDFKEQFSGLLPIVHKAMRMYRINDFDRDDYYQEGYVILDKLLRQKVSKNNLPIYFKVQYRQLLISKLRRQNAYKRTLNKKNYLELDKVSSQVADKSLSAENKVIFQDVVACFVHTLNKNEKRWLNELLNSRPISRIQKYRLKQKFLIYLGLEEFLSNRQKKLQ